MSLLNNNSQTETKPELTDRERHDELMLTNADYKKAFELAYHLGTLSDMLKESLVKK